MSVVVVGGGSIGLGWAIVFARAGRTVTLVETDAPRRAAIGAALAERLALLDEAAPGSLDVARTTALVHVTGDLGAALDGATYVQECVPEDLALKKELVALLDERCAPGTVLASSSSQLPASRWAEDLPGRSRCLVVHPGNPPHVIRVVEIVPAPFTDPQVVARVRTLLEEVEMVPVVVHHEPAGFVFNRLQGAMLREAYRLVEQGVVDPLDLDRIVTQGLGRRWAVVGPFATVHLNTRGGLRRHAQVMGPGYLRMAGDLPPLEELGDELVATVAARIEEQLPLERWDEAVIARDRALLAAGDAGARSQVLE